MSNIFIDINQVETRFKKCSVLILFIFLTGLLVELFLISQSLAVELTAHISENGLHGFVTMFEDNGAINVYTKLSVVGEWSWNIRELPVDYTELNDRCTDRKLGTM